MCGAWSRDLPVALQDAARASLCAPERPVATHGFGHVGAGERVCVRTRHVELKLVWSDLQCAYLRWSLCLEQWWSASSSCLRVEVR